MISVCDALYSWSTAQPLIDQDHLWRFSRQHHGGGATADCHQDLAKTERHVRILQTKTKINIGRASNPRPPQQSDLKATPVAASNENSKRQTRVKRLVSEKEFETIKLSPRTRNIVGKLWDDKSISKEIVFRNKFVASSSSFKPHLASYFCFLLNAQKVLL